MDEPSAQIQVERLIRTDNKDEFVSFLRSHQENSGSSTHIFSSTELMKLVCLHRAVGCATALLEGMTSLDVNIKALLDEGLSPLHFASQSLSYDLTKLFIRHGADTDMYYGHGSKDSAMLPLSAALKAICHHEYVSDWTPKKSIYKLLYIFCLPELKEPLDTIKLLASATIQTKVEAISLCCVKEGEIVQLAALLLVAWDILVAPHLKWGNTIIPIEQSMLGELKVLKHEIEAAMSKGSLVKRSSRVCERKKSTIESAVKMFNILWRARNVIENYRHSSRPKRAPKHQVPFDVGLRLFFEADLQLKRKDVYSNDIKCLREKIGLKDEGEPSTSKDEACLKKHVHSGSMLGTVAGNCAIGTGVYLPSRLFHTGRRLCFNPNSSGHQLVMKPSSIEFLPEAKPCKQMRPLCVTNTRVRLRTPDPPLPPFRWGALEALG